MVSEVRATLEQLLVADVALGRIRGVRLPIAGAYRLARLARLIGPELAQFNAHREQMVAEMGRGEELTPTHPRWLEFEVRMRELMCVEVVIPAPPLSIADLGDKAEVAWDDLMGMGPLLDME